MRFEIRWLIGKGGCGTVYQALDRTTGQQVALKVLTDDSASARARFGREVRAARQVNHPNVCRFFDAGTLDDGRPFVTMELLAGKTLRTVLHEGGRLDVEDAIEVAVQMLSALDAAHALGLVHRDVKPENVMLCGARVKLLDFGLCRGSIAEPFDGQTITKPSIIVGTPGYLAPEQLSGGKMDARTDIFAAGLVLFEMLTGRPAYRGKSVVQLIADLLAREVPSLRAILPKLPAVLDAAVARATAREPAFRYPSAGSFQHDLLQARTTIRRQLRAA